MQKLTNSMSSWGKTAYRITCAFGFDPKRLVIGIRGIARYIYDYIKYSKNNQERSLKLSLGRIYPIFGDEGQKAGHASGHYFHQDLWAARKIYQRRPEKHVDIGSRIDGFISHLLVFMDVQVIDIRPLKSALPELHFFEDDATELGRLDDNSVESLSSLHAAEHFGLGRYGDQIDPAAYESFIAALVRVLAPGGRLYFSVPLGEERVEFNAHRIFSPKRILDQFEALQLLNFDAVRDDGEIYFDCDAVDFSLERYALGLFELTK